MKQSEKSAPVLSPEQLAGRLTTATAMVGGHREAVRIQLTAVATGVLFFGTGPDLVQPMMESFASAPDTVALDELWTVAASSVPFLRQHLPHLTGWAGRPDAQAVKVSRACFTDLAQIDLIGSAAAENVGGELLGPVYSNLRSLDSQRVSGAFYTPMNLARLLAEMNPLVEGETFADPTCGAGVLPVAAAIAMRRRGLDPATVTWVLNDIDPVAVTLAGINAVVHSLGPRVVLTCGDGLRLGAADG
ncbi:N-6 DNA methylase [Branchiibius cervicis]|uniref:N-6 DNA methylase n=1 Tax=Branchiibius cervicis TaxID=908252 RepID=A0ABW2ATC7_9MICO